VPRSPLPTRPRTAVASPPHPHLAAAPAVLPVPPRASNPASEFSGRAASPPPDLSGRSGANHRATNKKDSRSRREQAIAEERGDDGWWRSGISSGDEEERER
uniref:Uncharacterized protein n=3 Tax=Aegilops tauschii TaxID=37682 RepID=A0A453RM11_AEGTS